ncbi:MAG TPA: PIN domain-containing protein [Caulobacteraceae bacterium]|nr:PIN domain-containing protein [Caulobacteraceae bacterium]
MKLSLDTNVLLELLDGNEAVRRSFETTLDETHEMFISVLVAHELRFGARLGGRDIELQTVETLLQRFPIEPFTEADAEGATQVRLGLERIGRRIGAMDMLIAGQAVNRGWSVVTANVHEFGRVAGLGVIDWTASPETL